MKSLNKVQIIGNIGKEPDIRETQDGKQVANLTVACSESWKTKDGGRQDKTEWVNVVAFGMLASIIQNYVKKGDKVYFEGKLQTRKYTDKNGVERYVTEVNADNMLMLGGNGSQSNNQVEDSSEVPF